MSILETAQITALTKVGSGLLGISRDLYELMRCDDVEQNSSLFLLVEFSLSSPVYTTSTVSWEVSAARKLLKSKAV